MPIFTILVLAACACIPWGGEEGGGGEGAGGTPPSTDGGGAPEVGVVKKAKEMSGMSKLINAGTDSSLPWPEPGLTAGQCNEITDGGPVEDGCFSGHIKCDESIVGHTRGGAELFNTRWWERNFCWPATEQHDGGDERLYKFSFPDEGEWRAWFTLDTPCADLDMMVFQYDSRTCPNGNTDVLECDAQVKPGTKRERAEAVTDGRWQHWVVVVEGKGADEGAFALTAQCRRGVR